MLNEIKFKDNRNTNKDSKNSPDNEASYIKSLNVFDNRL